MQMMRAAAALAAVLLVAGLAAAQGSVQIATAGGIATAANAKIDAAAVAPAAPFQGTPVDFSATVRNTGNAAGNISARITITPPGGGVPFLLVNSTALKAAGASLVLAQVGCANCTTVLGSWKVTVEALVNGTLADTKVFNYTVAAAPPPAVPGPGTGPTGGGPPAPEPALGSAPAPVFRDIAFVRQPVIVEVRPGDAREVDFLVVNNKRQDLTLQVQTLLPEQWVYFPQKVIGLPPNERAFMKAVLTPPKEAPPGDYRVAVKLADAGQVLAETFVILRVKTPAPGLTASTALRVLDLDTEKNQTRVNLVVRNGDRPLPRLEVVEEIPKVIVPRASFIVFTVPPEILEWDPKVQWTLLELLANETRTLTYTVPGTLPEWSPYIYFPVKQVTAFYEEGDPTLKVEAVADRMAPGRAGQLRIFHESVARVPVQVKGRLDPPAGWTVSPVEYSVTVNPGGRVPQTISLTPPPGTPVGTQTLVLTLSYEGSLRVVGVEVVVEVPGWDWWLILAVALAAGLAGLALRVKRQLRENFERLLRLESMKRVK